MAFDSAATIVPGRGTVLTAAPNTPPPDFDTVDPTDTAALTAILWDALGHTSRENAVAMAKEGGDPTIRGSWWDSALATTYSDVNWEITVNTLQVDSVSLGLAFGGGVHTPASSRFAVKSTIQAQEKALYILMVDGPTRMGIYIPRASVSIGDAPEIDPENFFEIQLAAQILTSTAGDRFQLFHPALGA
jgi:hypothetical protein